MILNLNLVINQNGCRQQEKQINIYIAMQFNKLLIKCRQQVSQGNYKSSFLIQIEQKSMKQRLIKNSLFYIVTLKQRLYQISLCWVLILPYQTLFILLLAIQSGIDNNSSITITSTLKSIWQKLNQTAIVNFFLIFQSIACILLCSAFLLFIGLKKNIGELDQRSNTLKKLVTVSAVLVMAIQAFLFNVTASILGIFTSLLQPELGQTPYKNEFYLIPFCCIAIIGVGVINYRIRIMGSFFILYMVSNFFTDSFSFVNCVAAIVASIYLIRNDEDHKFLLFQDRNLRKILHLVIISFSIWKLINLIQLSISQNSEPDGILTYIYLLVYIFISIVIGLVKFVCKVNRRLPPVIQLCQCLQNLRNTPQDLYSKMMAVQIENEYRKNIEGQSTCQIQHDQRMKNINDWNNDLWYNLVHEMIQKQYEKYPTLQTGIDMIKCRLMIKDKRLFEIIQFLRDLITKNKDESLTKLYQILKISLKIEQMYFKHSNTSQYPVIQTLREVDRLNESFYKSADKQMKKMHFFWETVISNKLKLEDEDSKNKQHFDHTEEIRKLTVQIYRGICFLEKTVKKIEVLSLAQRQKNVLKSIKQICFQLNHHKQQNAHQSQFHKNNEHSLSQISSQGDFLQFIEVVNQKITNISIKLLADLRYQKREVIGESLNFLISNVYMQSIDQTLRKHHEPVYKFNYLIPVKCADCSVILKSLRTYLEIDSNYGFKILFHFERTYSKKDPFIIYNTASNTVQSYNRAFIDVYKLDSQKINSKISSNYLNPDEIFMDLDLHDKNIQTKLSENGFETQYNCRLQTTKISKKNNAQQNIRVSLIQKQKGFMILKIMKGHRMKSIVGENTATQILSRSCASSNIQFENYNQLTNEFTGMRSPTQNQIFCKIQNPYETKISNKKLQISRVKKITLQFYAISFICVGLILFLSQAIVFIGLNYKIADILKKYNKDISNQYNQYTSLMLAYQEYFQQALIKIEKDRLIILGLDYDEQLGQRQESIEEKIDLFQKQYLGNLLNTNQNVLDYKIKFKYFDIQTDTSKTNLFDFSQNLLQHDSDQSLEFLEDNYPTFSDLIVRVNDQANGITNSVDLYKTIYYITSGVIFFIIATCLVLSTLIRLKVCWICSDVEYIFNLVNCSNLKQLFDELKEASKKIMGNGEEGKQKYIKSQKIFQSSILIEKARETQSKIMLHDQHDETEYIVKEQDVQKEQAEIKKKYEENKKSQLKHFAKNFGILEYACFAVMIVIASVVQTEYFSSKIENSYTVINYSIENKKISQNTIHQVLEVTNYFISKNLHKNDSWINPQPFMNKLTINDKLLPTEYFEQYTLQVFHKNQGNLCEALKDKSSVSFDQKVCLQIGGGIFKYGLTKTIEYLNQILYNSLKNEHWYTLSQISNLTLVQEIQYIQSMVRSISRQNDQEFNYYYVKFNQKLDQQAIGILLFEFALAVLLLMVVLNAKKFIYETSEVARGCFLLLPQKVLLQNQILDHIRKHDLLNRISQI